MLEWLKLLVHQYGLIGLLFSSFIGSTIFLPLSVELTFPVLIKAGIHKLAIILFASVGSLAGTLLNYSLGYGGMKYLNKKTRKLEMKKARHLMNKYGWAGLFIALALPIPLPVDPLTLLCGAAKMNIREFTAVVLAAKLLKYALFLGVIAIIL